MMVRIDGTLARKSHTLVEKMAGTMSLLVWIQNTSMPWTRMALRIIPELSSQGEIVGQEMGVLIQHHKL
jgi:hypothetical protein